MLRPLNGAPITFDASNENKYNPPIAPQRRVVYNRSSLCRISEPMKMLDSDHGRADTVWIRVISNNTEKIMKKGRRRTTDELAREAGVWTLPHSPTKIYVPPPKPNVVVIGRGASTSPALSYLPSPPSRSKPSGDIKHYLFKNAAKWTNEAHIRKEKEKAIQEEIEQYLLRNHAQNVQQKDGSPRAIKATFERKRIAAENKQEIERAIALRKWREARLRDLKLVVGGLDISNVPNTVLIRCRQIAQHGVRRVYDRHLRKRPISAKLPELPKSKADLEVDEVQPLTEDELSDEFHRKMRLVCSGRDSSTDVEMASALVDLVDPCTGFTLLHVACNLERFVQVQVLLSFPEVDANQKELTKGRTPLHLVAEVGSVKLIELFFSKRSDLNVDAVDHENWTPLHVAAHAGKTAAVELLLTRAGGCGKLQTKSGDSALHLASETGHYLTVAALLEFYSKFCPSEAEEKPLASVDAISKAAEEEPISSVDDISATSSEELASIPGSGLSMCGCYPVVGTCQMSSS